MRGVRNCVCVRVYTHLVLDFTQVFSLQCTRANVCVCVCVLVYTHLVAGVLILEEEDTHNSHSH